MSTFFVHPSRTGSLFPEAVLGLPPDEGDLDYLRRKADPELWAPRRPIIVNERCGSDHSLIATWDALYALLLENRKRGVDYLSTREIARRARVGRGRLTGPVGYIQRLVDKGLLRIVGTVKVAGFREQVSRYAIDMADLEQQSLLLFRDRVGGRRDLPDRPPSDLTQSSMLAAMGLSPGEAAASAPLEPPLVASSPFPGPTAHECDTRPVSSRTIVVSHGATLAPKPVSHETTLDPRGANALPGLASWRARTDPNGAISVPSGTDPDPGRTRYSERMVPTESSHRPQPARERTPAEPNMEGMRDGWSEGGTLAPREEIPTIQTVQALIAEANQQLLAQIRAIIASAANTGFPPANENPLDLKLPVPEGCAVLPFSLRELWAAERETVQQRDLQLLVALAAQCDAETGGHGLYWVGRAILEAEACLESHGRRPDIPYLRGVLRGWAARNDWGQSKRPSEERRGPPPERRITAPTTEAGSGAAGRVPEPVQLAGELHPTLATFYAFAHQKSPGLRLSSQQERQLVDRVRDQELWTQVCGNWLAEGYMFSTSQNVLDRYCVLEAQHAGERAASNGPSKLERDVAAVEGLDDADRAYLLERLNRLSGPDRRQLLDDLRRVPAERRAGFLSKLREDHSVARKGRTL